MLVAITLLAVACSLITSVVILSEALDGPVYGDDGVYGDDDNVGNPSDTSEWVFLENSAFVIPNTHQNFGAGGGAALRELLSRSSESSWDCR